MVRYFLTKRVDTQSRQFLVNVSTNVAVVLLNIIVGLWYTPYLIKHLGIATYGVVILATSFTQYMSVFNTSIDNAVGRFLTLDINKQNFAQANKTFNTAFSSGLMLVTILLPIVVLVAYFFPQLFDVPVENERSAQILFVAVMFSYLLIILRSIFSASTFAHNRLELKNIIIASNTLARVLVVVGLFALTTKPQAWQVGVATFIGAGISLLLAVRIWQKLTPELGIHRRMFDLAQSKSMFGMSGWLLINQVGSLLFLNIDLIVINWYLGAEVQGRYGSVLQLAILLRTLSAAVATALTPIALSQLARKDKKQMAIMTRMAVKWMGLLMALPIGVLVGMATPFLQLWLGREFVDLNWLIVVLVIHLSINLSITPLFSLQTALNKVRWPAVVTIVGGVLNLYLAIRFVNWGTVGLGVALAGAFVLTLKNALFTPIYGAYIQDLPLLTFFKDIGPGLLGTAFIIGISYGIIHFLPLETWLAFVSAVGILTIIYLILVYSVALSKKERDLLLSRLDSGA